MAQSITAPLHGDFIIGPGCLIALADQTATTAVQNFTTWGGVSKACNWITAQINFKSFTVGTGTVYPIFALDVADNSALTTNKRRLGAFQPALVEAIGAIPGTNPIHSFVIEGFAPDGGKAFARITVLFNGTSSGTFDV